MTKSVKAILMIVIWLCVFQECVSQEWIFLGLSGLSNKLTSKRDCSRSLQPGSYRHMLCRQTFSRMQSIKKGTRIAYRQCVKLFRTRHWNCSALEPSKTTDSPFGDALKGTREAAFISAVFAAGVVFAITADCRDGKIEGCQCDRSSHQNSVYGNSFIVRGCSENIKFGLSYSEKFIDTAEMTDRHVKTSKSNEILTMNLHNYRVGRKVIQESLRKTCKCHGMSGTCATKVCFKQLPQFAEIAKNIKKKYEHATYSKITVNNKKANRMSLEPVWPTFKKIGIDDLVYLIPSPNYCNFNKTLGVLGTTGRRCKLGNYASMHIPPEHCKILCCGRGYYAKKKIIKENCHCKFTWCCHVKCDTCYKTKIVHVCR